MVNQQRYLRGSAARNGVDYYVDAILIEAGARHAQRQRDGLKLLVKPRVKLIGTNLNESDARTVSIASFLHPHDILRQTMFV